MSPTKQDDLRGATVRELRLARQRVEQATLQEQRVRQMFISCTTDNDRTRLRQEVHAVSELREESISQCKTLQALFEQIDH